MKAETINKIGKKSLELFILIFESIIFVTYSIILIMGIASAIILLSILIQNIINFNIYL